MESWIIDKIITAICPLIQFAIKEAIPAIQQQTTNQQTSRILRWKICMTTLTHSAWVSMSHLFICPFCHKYSSDLNCHMDGHAEDTNLELKVLGVCIYNGCSKSRTNSIDRCSVSFGWRKRGVSLSSLSCHRPTLCTVPSLQIPPFLPRMQLSSLGVPALFSCMQQHDKPRCSSATLEDLYVFMPVKKCKVQPMPFKVPTIPPLSYVVCMDSHRNTFYKKLFSVVSPTIIGNQLQW